MHIDFIPYTHVFLLFTFTYTLLSLFLLFEYTEYLPLVIFCHWLASFYPYTLPPISTTKRVLPPYLNFHSTDLATNLY